MQYLIWSPPWSLWWKIQFFLSMDIWPSLVLFCQEEPNGHKSQSPLWCLAHMGIEIFEWGSLTQSIPLKWKNETNNYEDNLTPRMKLKWNKTRVQLRLRQQWQERYNKTDLLGAQEWSTFHGTVVAKAAETACKDRCTQGGRLADRSAAHAHPLGVSAKALEQHHLSQASLSLRYIRRDSSQKFQESATSLKVMAYPVWFSLSHKHGHQLDFSRVLCQQARVVSVAGHHSSPLNLVWKFEKIA